MSMYSIVTGAAGFVGSNIVAALNARGDEKIIAVDNLLFADKFKNLTDCEVADYIDKHEFLERLMAGFFDGQIKAIFHQGACSNTMETDGRYMMENNYRYSLSMLDWCQEQKVPFIYASSAATYGANQTFKEGRNFECPLNVYGYSKFLFDQIVRQRLPKATSQIVGMRYFNVYGPRESHKGRMASVAFHHYHQFQEARKVKLFEGYDGYAKGEQKRDFVYVGDAVKVNLYFLENPTKSGIFNLGTGCAQSFNELAAATVNSCLALEGKAQQPFEELVRQGYIDYIPFPENLKGKYQSFTQADLTLLREAGYAEPMARVEEGVSHYVKWLHANSQ